MISPQMTAEAKQQIIEQYGLDRPMHVQYISYMESVLNGNLGISFQRDAPVAQLVLSKALNTVVLMVFAVLLTLIIGPIIGAFLAWNRGTKKDTVGTGLVLIMFAAPVFWTGMLGIMMFSYQLGWLPSSGMHSATFTADSLWGNYFSIDFFKHLVLPLTVTTLYFMAGPTLVMRNNLIDVLGADFIQMNRAEGLSEFRILYRHAVRNSLLPVLHHGALLIGFAFGGSVIIETVFSWPGVGRLLWSGVLNEDYPLAMGGFVMIAVIIIILNFLVDFVSVYIDPRVAEEEV